MKTDINTPHGELTCAEVEEFALERHEQAAALQAQLDGLRDVHQGMTCAEVEAYADLRTRMVADLRAARARTLGALPRGADELREALAAVARVEAVLADDKEAADALTPTTIGEASVHSGTYLLVLATVAREHLPNMLPEVRGELLDALAATTMEDNNR